MLKKNMEVQLGLIILAAKLIVTSSGMNSKVMVNLRKAIKMDGTGFQTLVIKFTLKESFF